MAPSITPWYSNNLAVTSFEINRHQGGDLVPEKLRSTYLNLQPTIGLEKPLPLDQLEFRELDYAKQYGVKDMTASSILALAATLERDEKMHRDYIIRKLGFEPSSPAESEQALSIMLDKGIITSDSFWPQLCVMTSNINVEEYDFCIDLDPTTLATEAVFLQ